MNQSQIKEISSNKFLLKRIINKNYPLSNYIDVSQKKVFCPFHYNVNTPSAQIYTDRHGDSHIYCFSENKTYTSYDYIRLVLNINPISYLYNLSIDDSELEEERERIQEKEREEISYINSLSSLSINDFFKTLYTQRTMKNAKC